MARITSGRSSRVARDMVLNREARKLVSTEVIWDEGPWEPVVPVVEPEKPEEPVMVATGVPQWHDPEPDDNAPVSLADMRSVLTRVGKIKPVQAAE